MTRVSAAKVGVADGRRDVNLVTREGPNCFSIHPSFLHLRQASVATSIGSIVDVLPWFPLDSQLAVILVVHVVTEVMITMPA